MLQQDRQSSQWLNHYGSTDTVLQQLCWQPICWMLEQPQLERDQIFGKISAIFSRVNFAVHDHLEHC